MMATIAGVALKTILPDSADTALLGEVLVTGLAVDSRAVVAGDCFLAYPGHAVDGRRYIADALARGAAAVVAEARDLAVDSALPVVAIDNLKNHLGTIASRFFGNPSQHLQVVAVTGTNGKTTVTQLIAQAMELAGRKAGLIGTLGNGPVGCLAPTTNTTPDIVAINSVMRQMQDAGIDVVAMEASSHGLVQGRLDGLTLQCGVITNLSRDHLDYHGSMEAYRDAKALLAQHESLQHLILNADDAAVHAMAALAAPTTRVSTFSLRTDSTASVKATAVQYVGNGLKMDVTAGGCGARIESALVGEFNAANLLAALTVLLALDVGLEAACRALGAVAPVEGRMQMINAASANSEPAVVVDFAHTPDALEKVLVALRRHCHGALWCVFGCGGDRDAGKRPLMGKAVALHADKMVVTSDNPRSEKPGRIITDIVRGIPVAHGFEIIEDRAVAVDYAILNAASDDVVLLAGKGHEDYQEVQGIKHPYSDVQVARRALEKRRQLNQNLNG